MKKLIAILGVVSTFALVGCEYEESQIYYEGNLRPVSQVEEIIADQLEVENPDFDLEVSIYEEVED